MPTIIIIGGGAAGLSAAICLARDGQKVLLLEQNSKIGKKILVSGNGKCNITNKYINPNRFHGENRAFIDEVLSGYAYEAVESFFGSIGLELVEGNKSGSDGQMFPMSLQSSSVVELLEYEANKLGVEIVCDCVVNEVAREDEIFILNTSMGMKKSAKLLIASGSQAAPRLGGSSAGARFALSLGHTLVPSMPSLVQLCSEEQWVKKCTGVKVAGIAKLYANSEFIAQRNGDLLFTDYGISGLAILDISREVSVRLANYEYCELWLDLMPALTKEKLTNLLLSRINSASTKPIELWLSGMVNKKLISVILEQSKSKIKTESELNRKEIAKLVYSIKNLKLSISETKGFGSAEVSTGGVDTNEINPATMESLLVPNLYFAGEIIDVDGDRGGFNFHFAWVSGMRAGRVK